MHLISHSLPELLVVSWLHVVLNHIPLSHDPSFTCYMVVIVTYLVLIVAYLFLVVVVHEFE